MLRGFLLTSSMDNEWLPSSKQKQGVPVKGMNRLVMEYRIKVSFNGQGVAHSLIILEIWIIVIRSQNQWYHELGPSRANLFNRHNWAHNPKVLEVSIIAILLQSLQNYEFSPEKANSFNGHSLAYILKIPGILIIAIQLQTLQNHNLGLVRPNIIMILENLVIVISSHG